MQDRFKFRTYIPDLKFFKYWGWIDKNHYIGLCASGDISMPELLEKYTEQCTGLKDKNGNLIFEGDLVKYFDFVCETKYKNGSFILEVVKGKKDVFFHFYATSFLEVIGNIYENPELLEDKE